MMGEGDCEFVLRYMLSLLQKLTMVCRYSNSVSDRQVSSSGIIRLQIRNLSKPYLAQLQDRRHACFQSTGWFVKSSTRIHLASHASKRCLAPTVNNTCAGSSRGQMKTPAMLIVSTILPKLTIQTDHRTSS